MGMFTTIIYEGNEYQIKTGFDQCETYRVGDKIPWEPDNFWPGHHIDGVYDSVGGPYSSIERGPWFIIKDCIIVAAEPFVGPDGQRLRQKYGITDPPRDLWPEIAWRKQKERKERLDAEYEAFKKERGLGDLEAACAFYMHKRLQEPSASDLLFPARKVHP